jgi:hypothetical protein
VRRHRCSRSIILELHITFAAADEFGLIIMAEVNFCLCVAPIIT